MVNYIFLAQISVSFFMSTLLLETGVELSSNRPVAGQRIHEGSMIPF